MGGSLLRGTSRFSAQVVGSHGSRLSVETTLSTTASRLPCGVSATPAKCGCSPKCRTARQARVCQRRGPRTIAAPGSGRAHSLEHELQEGAQRAAAPRRSSRPTLSWSVGDRIEAWWSRHGARLRPLRGKILARAPPAPSLQGGPEPPPAGPPAWEASKSIALLLSSTSLDC